MKKSLKISLGIFGIVSIGAVSLATVISCSSKNNDAKVNNQSSSTSSSSSSSNESYVPYSTLFSQSILENPTTKNTSWTYDEALTYWTTYFKNEIAKEGFENVVSNDWYAYKEYLPDYLVKNTSCTSGLVDQFNLNFNNNDTFNISMIYTSKFIVNNAWFDLSQKISFTDATLTPNLVSYNNDNSTSYFGGWYINSFSHYYFNMYYDAEISNNWTNQDFSDINFNFTVENYKQQLQKTDLIYDTNNIPQKNNYNDPSIFGGFTVISDNTITRNFQLYSTFGYDGNYGINFGLVSDIPSSITN